MSGGAGDGSNNYFLNYQQQAQAAQAQAQQAQQAVQAQAQAQAAAAQGGHGAGGHAAGLGTNSGVQGYAQGYQNMAGYPANAYANAYGAGGAGGWPGMGNMGLPQMGGWPNAYGLPNMGGMANMAGFGASPPSGTKRGGKGSRGGRGGKKTGYEPNAPYHGQAMAQGLQAQGLQATSLQQQALAAQQAQQAQQTMNTSSQPSQVHQQPSGQPTSSNTAASNPYPGYNNYTAQNTSNATTQSTAQAQSGNMASGGNTSLAQQQYNYQKAAAAQAQANAAAAQRSAAAAVYAGASNGAPKQKVGRPSTGASAAARGRGRGRGGKKMTASEREKKKKQQAREDREIQDYNRRHRPAQTTTGFGRKTQAPKYLGADPDALRAAAKAKPRVNKYIGMCIRLIDRMRAHKHAWPFVAPVDTEALGLYDYHTLISRPMDLGTLRSNLDSRPGDYPDPESIAVDVRTVFSNCRRYNQPGSDVVEMCNSLESMWEKKYVEIEAAWHRDAAAEATKIAEAAAAREAWEAEQRSKYGHDWQAGWRAAVEAEARAAVESSQVAGVPVGGGEEYAFEENYEDRGGRGGKRGRATGSSGGPKKKDKDDIPYVAPGTYKTLVDNREMSLAEKKRLSKMIRKLPMDSLTTVCTIIQESMPSLADTDPEELTIDIDSLDAVTLRRLEAFSREVLYVGPPQLEAPAPAPPVEEDTGLQQAPPAPMESSEMTSTDMSAGAVTSEPMGGGAPESVDMNAHAESGTGDMPSVLMGGGLPSGESEPMPKSEPMGETAPTEPESMPSLDAFGGGDGGGEPDHQGYSTGAPPVTSTPMSHPSGEEEQPPAVPPSAPEPDNTSSSWTGEGWNSGAGETATGPPANVDPDFLAFQERSNTAARKQAEAAQAEALVASQLADKEAQRQAQAQAEAQAAKAQAQAAAEAERQRLESERQAARAARDGMSQTVNLDAQARVMKEFEAESLAGGGGSMPSLHQLIQPQDGSQQGQDGQGDQGDQQYGQ